MDLDNLREILYAFTKECYLMADAHGVDILQEEEDIEGLVEDFITGREDLLGDIEDRSEESY